MPKKPSVQVKSVGVMGQNNSKMSKNVPRGTFSNKKIVETLPNNMFPPRTDANKNISKNMQNEGFHPDLTPEEIEMLSQQPGFVRNNQAVEEKPVVDEESSNENEILEKVKPLFENINVDLSPISFGVDYDHLPIIRVTSILPSGGYSYPEGYSIYYRPFVFGEIGKLSEVEPGFPELARIVLSGIRTSFPINMLTFYDFTYLALLRKISSVEGSAVKATIGCTYENCDQLNTYKIDVKAGGDIQFWDIKYKNLPLLVDMKFDKGCEETYKFSPLTLERYIKLYEMGLHKDRFSIIAAQCISHPFEEMLHNIKISCGDETTVLKEIDDIFIQGVKPIPVKCSACNRILYLRLESGGALIRPFRGSEDIVKSRIRFGEIG